MIFGPLIMILMLAAVIAAVVLLVRWAGGQWPGRGRSKGAHHSTSSRSATPAARSIGRNTCAGEPTCKTSRLPL